MLRLTIPEWNKKLGIEQYTWLKKDDLPEELQKLLEDDEEIRVWAKVNLDATKPEELKFEDWEIE